jgi:hypothetical protein
MINRSTLLVFVVCALLTGCATTGYGMQGGRWVFVHPAGDSWTDTESDPIEGADISSFKLLSDSEYAADKNAVYYRGDKIPNAIPSSFRHFGGDYWSDASHVFFVNEELSGANPKTFSPLPIAPWSRDDKLCFRASSLVPSSDPKTFVAIDFHWAKDATHYYAYKFANVFIVPCDYSTMKVLSRSYAKDKDRVFWLGKEVVGADAATFEPVGCCMGKDKFRRYSGPEEFWMDKKARATN